MLLNLVGKNIELTEGLKTQAEKKISKLDKYFNEEIEGRAVLSTQKNNQTVEVTVFLPGTILRAEETTQDMYTSMDKAVSALERQVRKYKTRLKKRYQDSSETIRFENVEITESEEQTGKIVRRKNFDLNPMSEEEAMLQMELLDHKFFVFSDADTDKLSVLYKRNDGDYGIIEVE